MGQIRGKNAHIDACNLRSLSSFGTPAAGQHILVSTDNSAMQNGQGNFDAYVVGDGYTAATALQLHQVVEGLYEEAESFTDIQVSVEGSWNATMFDEMLPAGTIIYSKSSGLSSFYFCKQNGSYQAPLINDSTVFPYTLEADCYGVTAKASQSGTLTIKSTSKINVLNKLSADVSALNTAVTNESQRITDVENSVSNLSGDVSDLGTAVKTLEEELTTTKKKDVDIQVSIAGGWGNPTFFDEMMPAGTVIKSKSSGLSSFYFCKQDGGYQNPLITNDTVFPYTLEADAYGVVAHDAQSGTLTVEKDVEVSYFEEIDEEITTINDSIDELEGQIGNAVEIICPSTIYAVVGQELNLYYDSLFKAMDDGLGSPFGYYLDIRLGHGGNNYGIRHDRFWQIDSIPAALVGTNTITIEVFDNKNNSVATKNVSLVVVANTALASAKNILLIGDSTTNNGNLPKYTADAFTAQGRSMNFVGTRERNGVKHEGWPGYTTGSFTHAEATNYYIFQVPTNSVASAGDVYSDGTRTFTVVNLFQESAETLALRCTLTSGSGTPSSTGTLTKVSGQSASSASMAYSDVDYQNGNPFWNASNNSVDFTYYRNTIGLASTLDAVVILLGVNDCLSAIDTATSIANLQTLVTAIHADSPNCKVIVQLVTSDANTISGWQAYAAAFSYARKWRYQKYVWQLRKAICETFTGQNVYVGQAALGLDRFYGYPYTTTAINSYVSTTEILHTNCVHPSDEGYHMLANGYFNQLRALL